VQDCGSHTEITAGLASFCVNGDAADHKFQVNESTINIKPGVFEHKEVMYCPLKM
jgi:hypothetical protein